MKQKMLKAITLHSGSKKQKFNIANIAEGYFMNFDGDIVRLWYTPIMLPKINISS